LGGEGEIMKCEICEGNGVIDWNNLTVICPKCNGKDSKVSCADCNGTGDDDPVFGGSCKKCNGLGYILPGHNTKRLYNYYKTVGAWGVEWAKERVERKKRAYVVNEALIKVIKHGKVVTA
jgi:hypothetical protein